MSGLGIVDRIFGFIVGAGKFFLIAAVIAYAAYNIKVLKTTVDESSMKDSILFPILVKTGAYIMKIDPTEVSNNINEQIDEATKKVSDGVSDTLTKKVEESAKEIVETTKKELDEVTTKENGE